MTSHVLSFALLCALASPALAKDTSSLTRYPVTGKTAAEVYEDIKKNAPRVDKNATFAFTMIATRTDKHTAVSKASCRYNSFKTSAIYNFVVPAHSNLNDLKPKTRAKWLSFVEYLKAHEASHRSFWQACFADYDAQSLALAAADCDQLDAEREQIFTAQKRKCLAQDEAFDVVFRKAVLREPFVAEALKKPIRD